MTDLTNEQRYYDTLRRIAREYQTAARILKGPSLVGLDEVEELEMAYENIQAEAAAAIKGKRRPK